MKKTIKSTLVLTLALALICASVVFATACGTKKVESIEITTAPTITEYVEGDLFNTAGMVVTAKYEDGTTAAVTGYTVSATAALTPADTSVTVTYDGQTATQEITVSGKAIASLSVAQNPKKIVYTSDEVFDPAGMKLLAVYNDGTSELVTDFDTYPAARKLNVNDKSVTVSYGGMTFEQPVVVTAVNTSPTNAPIVYKAVGTADVGGQKANINFVFRENGIVTGILESGMGADTDNLIANFISFPGTWEITADGFAVKLNDFTFDPQSILGLVGMIPEEMLTPDLQAMIDTLTEMDPIDITGCTTTATLAEGSIGFNADISAMGITLPLECKGELPADLEFAASEKVDAEYGDISGMSMKNGTAISGNKSANRGFVVGGTASANEGSVLKMEIDSAEAAQDVVLVINASAAKKNVDVNTYLGLKVNGEEVTLAGSLESSTKYADLTATINLIKGKNTIELIWKQTAAVKVDYFTFSTGITLLDPTYGEI